MGYMFFCSFYLSIKLSCELSIDTPTYESGSRKNDMVSFVELKKPKDSVAQ